MDIEKDLFGQDGNGSDYYKNDGQSYELKPECIIVEKVFDSCFYRECESAKAVNLPSGSGTFIDPTIVYGPGFIIDGSLNITSLRKNFARVRFGFRVPFTLTVFDSGVLPPKSVTINDFVEFTKDIEVFMPEAPSEFSYKVKIETRSETLRSEIVGDKLILAMGVFVVIKVVGDVQVLVQAFGYCPTPREAVIIAPEDIYKEFDKKPLPNFFPPEIDQIDLNI